MANSPIETDFENKFANPDIYAEHDSKGNKSLNSLLKYCYTKKMKVINCSPGNNKSCKYAFVYFASTEQELSLYRTIIKNLKAENIADFNFEIRAFVNADFPEHERYRGVIIRSNPFVANLLFEKTLYSLQNRSSFSNRDIVDYFNSIVFYFKLRHIDTKDLKLLYYSNDDNKGHEKYYLKISEILYQFKDIKYYLNGPIKPLSSLTPESKVSDIAGIFEVDCSIKDINQNVLSKILK